MTDGKPIVAIMAHPDDAEICMGGTLARCVAAGRAAHVVISSVPDQCERRRGEANAAARMLGFHLHWVTGSDTWHVEDVPSYRLVAEFDRFLTTLQPGIVFTHSAEDPHYDHVCVARAVAAAMRRRNADLYFCEPPNLRTPLSPAFQPDTFIDVTDWLEESLSAVRAHESQSATRGFDEQILARARLHGSRIGVQYAEAFQTAWRTLIL
jgi:LmbE family N-acetylglucosaminyl deacetylase